MKKYSKVLIILLLIIATGISSYVILFKDNIINSVNKYEAQQVIGYNTTIENPVDTDIGVTLLENGEEIATGRYGSENIGEGILFNNLLNGEQLKPGKEYREELSVENTGTMDEYVRVEIYKNWTENIGEREVPYSDLSSDLIQVNLINTDDWTLDEEASIHNRIILYYKEKLNVGERTVPFCDSIKIESDDIPLKEEEVSNENGYRVIETSSEYEDLKALVTVTIDTIHIVENVGDA